MLKRLVAHLQILNKEFESARTNQTMAERDIFRLLSKPFQAILLFAKSITFKKENAIALQCYKMC